MTHFQKFCYWGVGSQAELDAKYRDITTFVTSEGLFSFKRLMFGISCATEIFQYIISQIILGCPRARNISDDIIIGGVGKEDHDRNWRHSWLVWRSLASP